MSNQEPTSDSEWKKRKMYLLQCFLGLREDSSPVRETPTAQIKPSTEDVPSDSSGSVCSVPSLIIERTPQRNKHDEPDEYYEALFRRILKLYKHLFVKNRNMSSFDELEPDDESPISPRSRRDSSVGTRSEVWSSPDREDISAEEESLRSFFGEQAGEPPEKWEDTLFPLKLDDRSIVSPVEELEVMRSHRDEVSGGQFTPPLARPDVINTTPEQSPELVSAVHQRATTSSTPAIEPDAIPRASTPKPERKGKKKRKAEESEHAPGKKKKTKSERRQKLFKNIFVGPKQVFDLVERFSDDYASTTSSEE